MSICVFAEDSPVYISQIKHFHISTCNEFHHSTDQFKIPPQTDGSRLQKRMRTSSVKQHKDETAASGLGYFWATALLFIEIKADLKGGEKSVFCLTEHGWWRWLQHHAKSCLGHPISQGQHCVLEHLNVILKSRNSKPFKQKNLSCWAPELSPSDCDEDGECNFQRASDTTEAGHKMSPGHPRRALSIFTDQPDLIYFH